MNQSNDFEKKHVINIYEKICSHFDQTRYHCWPLVKEYISTLDSDCLADVGCGNGGIVYKEMTLIIWDLSFNS